MTITSPEKFKFEAGKSLNNQDLMFQSRNVEASKSSSGSYRYLTHTTDKAMMEKERQDTKYKELLVCNVCSDGSNEVLSHWRRFNQP